MKWTTKRSKGLMKMTKLSNHSKVNCQYKKENLTLQCFVLLDCLRVLERLVLHIYLSFVYRKINRGDILFCISTYCCCHPITHKTTK